MKPCDSLDGDRQSQSTQDQLTAILDDYFAALRRGERPSREQLLKAHPELAHELSGHLNTLDILQGCTEFDLDGVEPSPERAAFRALGDYQLIREVGRGGMGVVYEAQQISLNRRVALKILPFAAVLDPRHLQRFKNEAIAAASLDHPHIVEVYGVGSERSIHFYAMRFIDGVTFAEVIHARSKEKASKSPRSTSKPDHGASRPVAALQGSAPQMDLASEIAPDTSPELQAAVSTLLPDSPKEHFRRLAELGIQAAEALEHAHQMGIVHRDIKPSNLMLDERGKLWITDFGLARTTGDASMTVTGELVGTLRYMSPEQASAKRSTVDHRTDIYSLGATFYELLTSQPMFAGDERQKLLQQIAIEEPINPRSINAMIPKDLETIILKSIDKSAAERFGSARELADDLRRFLENQPIAARRPNLLTRARSWSRRHPAAMVAFAAIASVTLIFLTGVTVSRWQLVSESRRSVTASISQARIALEANDVRQAKQRLIEASARINADRLTDPVLLEKTAALNEEVERYEEFVPLLERARRSRSGEEVVYRKAAYALSLYHVMSDSNWPHSLRTSDLPQVHVERVVEAIYQLLLLHADQLTRWSIDSDVPEPMRHERRVLQCREAIVHLEKAKSFHSPSRGYYWLMANCSQILGDDGQEKQLRTTALTTPPHSADELFFMYRDKLWGKADNEEFTNDEQLRLLRDMLRLEPAYYNGLFFMAMKAAEIGRYEEAVIAYSACVALDPDDSVAILNRALAEYCLADYVEAKMDLELALLQVKQSAPNPNSIRSSIALLFDRIAWTFAVASSPQVRDGELAVEGAQLACEATDFKDGEKLYTLAVALAEAGNYESAVGRAQEAIALCPSDQVARRDEMMVYLEKFQSREPWRNVDESQAEYQQNYNNIAWRLATSSTPHVRDGRLAVQQAHRACMAAEYKDHEALDTLAAAYAETGDFASAVHWAKQAIELNKNDASQREQYKDRLKKYRNNEAWREPDGSGR